MNETLNKLKEKVKIERRYLIPGASVGILLSVILLWALITKIFIPGNRYNGAAGCCRPENTSRPWNLSPPWATSGMPRSR